MYYIEKRESMKLNLKKKNEARFNIGVSLYDSDKKKLTEYAESKGITVSIVLRSLINDLLDGNLDIEL